MKTAIYYFTGTGNSLFIARELSKKIDGCELIPIAKIINEPFITAEAERVGFVFPLNYYGLPLIVDEFINKINLEKCRYIFFVENRGASWSPEYITSNIQKILRKKGKALSAGFKFSMPSNYIKEYNLNSQSTVERKYKFAEAKIAEIAQVVNSNRELIEKDSMFVSGLSKLINKVWQSKVHNSDKLFYSDNSCSSCGICEQVCPVNNIVMSDGKPKWKHNCQECLACIHLCPKTSIQFGNKTINRGRYHHPSISLKEFMAQK